MTTIPQRYRQTDERMDRQLAMAYRALRSIAR